MKRILLIAFYFPPFHRSSGSLRVLKFIKYLPEFGFEPVVLTANPRAYDKTDDNLYSQLPETLTVHRAFALDAKQHLSFRGSYLDVTALPDRYSSWIPAAIAKGQQVIRKEKIDAVFSTSPIPSAHIIAYALNRLTGKSWIADFRDPVWDQHYQGSETRLRAWQKIEAMSVKNAQAVTVTTHGIRQLFLERYARIESHKINVIDNGYDESDFAGISTEQHSKSKSIRLVHAGLLDPVDRDPVPFFRAIGLLLERKPELINKLNIDLFAPGDESGTYARQIENLSLSEVIQIRPALPYHLILQEMIESDLLLLFQGKSCDTQIPAKLYEYLRIGRPILALTTEGGETGRLLRSLRAGEVVPLDKCEPICFALEKLISQIEQGAEIPAAKPEIAAQFSRRSQTKNFADLLHSIT